MKPPPTEKSYHIFYQMMAGLHPDERAQLGLSHFGIKDLNYLNMGDTQTDEMEDAERFEQWRNSLAILGIPFMDVIRILSAILLLGNVRFTPRYVWLFLNLISQWGQIIYMKLHLNSCKLMIFPVNFSIFNQKKNEDLKVSTDSNANSQSLSTHCAPYKIRP